MLRQGYEEPQVSLGPPGAIKEVLAGAKSLLGLFDDAALLLHRHWLYQCHVVLLHHHPVLPMLPRAPRLLRVLLTRMCSLPFCASYLPL